MTGRPSPTPMWCWALSTPTALAGGKLAIDRSLSEAAVMAHVGKPLSLPLQDAAHGIRAVANAAMARAMRAVTVERGRDPRDLTLMAFGGNGGVHAPDLARQLGIPRVVIPPMSGIFSALGMLASDIEHTALKTVSRRLDKMDSADLAAIKKELQQQVAGQLAADGYQAERTAFLWEADLRHEGQATELTVPFEGEDLDQIRERFVAEYFKTYGYRDSTPIELMKLRVAGRGLRDNRLDFGAMKIAARAGSSQGGTRAISFARGEAAVAVEIVDRSAVGFETAPGPADHRGIRRHHHRAARRQRVQGCDRLHRSGVRGMKVDPITFAVIKSGLDSIADDMAYTVVRIARSEIVKDVMDFSAALCAGDGQMVAQAKTIAQHLGAIPEAMASVLAKFEGDLHEGDVVIMNDPYHGGMHLPDIFMFVPIFFGGARRAFAVVICHHTDVGGRVPGSNASDSTEIYQEGLRIPPLKLYDRGVLNTTLETLIKINVRVPDRVLGRPVGAICRRQVGKRGLEKLLQRYGADEVDAYMQELLDYAERLTRQEIKTWPKGTYRFLDYIDSDGFSDTPIPINVAITVNGDGTLLVDYTGSSPQVKGALNSTLSFTHSLTYLSVRCVLAKDVPNNVGLFRCIKVKAPEASVLNPVMPAPCAARALTGYRVFDAMLGALAQIVPDKVPAAGEGGNSVICISGLRPNRQPFIIVDMICGAWGGRPDKDGLEAVTNASQNLSNMPVEVMEAEHPVRIEDYSFVRIAAAPGSIAAASACGAAIAFWRPRRCCNCAPTASRFSLTA